PQLEALRPKAVVAAVPAIPVIAADVHETRRVALDLRQSEGLGARVLEAAERNVAARAEHRSRPGKTRVEEEPLAERDRARISGDAIGRILPRRRRPRAMRHDARALQRGESCLRLYAGHHGH